MAKTNFEVDKDNLEVRITRVFDATPERMWRAFSDPKEVAQWWRNTTIDKHEFKVGGAWRYIDKGQGDGKEYPFNGVYKEIDEPRKISRTFEYEPWAGHGMLETVTFEPQADGKTLVTSIAKYANLDDLNRMVQSGMEHGAVAGFERIAKLVENS